MSDKKSLLVSCVIGSRKSAPTPPVISTFWGFAPEVQWGRRPFFEFTADFSAPEVISIKRRCKSLRPRRGHPIWHESRGKPPNNGVLESEEARRSRCQCRIRWELRSELQEVFTWAGQPWRPHLHANSRWYGNTQREFITCLRSRSVSMPADCWCGLPRPSLIHHRFPEDGAAMGLRSGQMRNQPI